MNITFHLHQFTMELPVVSFLHSPFLAHCTYPQKSCSERIIGQGSVTLFSLYSYSCAWFKPASEHTSQTQAPFSFAKSRMWEVLITSQYDLKSV